MRCFCCDKVLPEGEGLDVQTGRYYCVPCFEPTIYEMLRASKADREADEDEEAMQLLLDLVPEDLGREYTKEEDPYSGYRIGDDYSEFNS